MVSHSPSSTKLISNLAALRAEIPTIPLHLHNRSTETTFTNKILILLSEGKPQAALDCALTIIDPKRCTSAAIFTALGYAYLALGRNDAAKFIADELQARGAKGQLFLKFQAAIRADTWLISIPSETKSLPSMSLAFAQDPGQHANTAGSNP